MKISKTLLFSLIMAFTFISTRAVSYWEVSSKIKDLIQHNNRSHSHEMNRIIDYYMSEPSYSERKPCFDFYQHATSSYYAESESKNFFAAMWNIYVQSTNDFFEQETWHEHLADLRAKMHYYKTKCELKILEFPNILGSLERIKTLNWPNWTLALEQDEWEQDFDWPQALGVLRRYGFNNLFFKEHVTLAYNNSSKLIIEFEMPDKIILNKVLYNVRNITTDIFGVENAVYQNVLHKIKALDEHIFNVREHHYKYSDKVEKEIFTISDLQQKVPQFDWLKYFNGLLEGSITDYQNLEIQFGNTKYMQDILTLLDQTADKHISFYILLRFLNYSLKIMPTDYYCVKNMVRQFSFGANYLQKLNSQDFEENKIGLQNIFERLKTQFMQVLEKNKYELKESELQYLKQKLQQMGLRVGETPLHVEPTYYQEFYKNAPKKHEGATFETYLQEMTSFRVKKQHEHLREAPERQQLDYFLAYDDDFGHNLEPFFVPQRNIIIVPLAFLNPPYFSPYYEKTFQYATAGFGIARALVDAFILENLGFNANGIEDQIGYSILQNTQYQQQLKCFRFPYFELNDKTIADITGFQLTLDTFIDEIPDENELENGEKISKHDKKFFFRYWANYFGDDRYAKSYDGRVNVIVAHAQQFATTYNCTRSHDVCRLW